MTISLIVTAMTAFGLVGALALFVALKGEMERRTHKQNERVEAMLARLLEAETKLAPAPELAEAEAGGARSGINFSKRVQVARMLREGEDVETIAVTLGIPRSEVHLLASLQSLHGSAKATGKAMTKAAGSE